MLFRLVLYAHFASDNLRSVAGWQNNSCVAKFHPVIVVPLARLDTRISRLWVAWLSGLGTARQGYVLAVWAAVPALFNANAS